MATQGGAAEALPTSPAGKAEVGGESTLVQGLRAAACDNRERVAALGAQREAMQPASDALRSLADDLEKEALSV